jgi:hypothetical protein
MLPEGSAVAVEAPLATTEGRFELSPGCPPLDAEAESLEAEASGEPSEPATEWLSVSAGAGTSAAGSAPPSDRPKMTPPATMAATKKVTRKTARREPLRGNRGSGTVIRA